MVRWIIILHNVYQGAGIFGNIYIKEEKTKSRLENIYNDAIKDDAEHNFSNIGIYIYTMNSTY